MSSTRLASGTSLRASTRYSVPGHAGHALVGDEQRDLVAARDELA